MPQQKVTRRLAAIVSLDVVGFSRRMADDEEGTLAELKSHRQELIDPTVAQYRGRVVKLMGDGALLEFASVVDALHACVEIQRRMPERNDGLPAERCIEFRIGVNLGDVIVDGEDIYGDGVNVAARVEELARPGEVWLSHAVFHQVKAKVDVEIEDLGEQRLKNIPEPVKIYRVKPEYGQRRSPELRGVGDDLPLPELPSIAILPFKNLGGDSEQDYLADGFHFDIQAALLRVTGLFLIASGTVGSYRGRKVTAEAAGREMGVRYILEAGVRRTGKRIGLTVQLTDIVSQQVVWAGNYDQALEDAPTVQDEIAAEVLKALNFKLQTGEEARVFQGTLTNPEARDCFYRGLTHLPMMSKDGNAAARKMFERVTRLQPESPVGPTYMAFSHWTDVFREWTDPKEKSLEQAVGWANKALEFEGTNGLAHVVLAYVHLTKRRHDEALATGYKAVQLRPSCPMAIGFLANILLYWGRSAEAVTRIREAMRISPLYPPWFLTILAAAYRDDGDIGSSMSVARQAIEIGPSDIDARLILCDGSYHTDRLQQAKSLVQEILAIEPLFSIAGYIQSQPYKDQKTLNRLAVSLREAGLPE